MNPMAPTGTSPTQTTWPASIALEFERKGDKTRLTRSRHHGPLYIQKPFYPEGLDHPHAYILHPPGGIVSGDCLQIGVKVGPDAGALITTPGAARIYRARDLQPRQRQQIFLEVAAGGVIEWFPLETIVYNKACVELDTTIDLAEDSHFFGWEISCFGLPASGEYFTTGRFRQNYMLLYRGVPVFIDRFVLEGDDVKTLMGSTAGLRGHPVSGFFLCGPFPLRSEDLVQVLRDRVTAMGLNPVASVTQVGHFCVGRYLGCSAEQAKSLFAQWWTLSRPRLIKRKACAPRIWLT